MEITDKTITLVGVVSAAAVSVVALAIGNNEMAVLGLGIVGTAIGVPVATSKLSTSSTKQAPTQATEDTASDLSTEDLVSEVDNSASTTDTTASTVEPVAEETSALTAEGLSDEYIQKVIGATIEKMKATTPENAEPTVVTQ